MQEALDVARQQPVLNGLDEVLPAAVETGAATGNADGGNPDGKRGWKWGLPMASAQRLVTAMVKVYVQGFSRSTAAAIASRPTTSISP